MNIFELYEELLSEETFSDIYKFLARVPNKMTFGTVYYVSSMNSSMNKNIITANGKEPNPMYDRVTKHTRFSFGWQDTYKRAVERSGVDWELGQRRGEFEKVEGFEVLEKKGDKFYLPIIPQGSNYKLFYNGVDGVREISKEELKPYVKDRISSPSGTEFRLLMLDNIYKLTGGGNVWVNPSFGGTYRGIDRD